MNKEIILGTAMWGWSIDSKECFGLLDIFYANGGRLIDTAKNYPINGVKEQFMFAENRLLEWIRINRVDDLKIIYKMGSLNNTFSTKNNLKPQFINDEYDRLSEKFSKNLYLLMIHWDNRDSIVEVKKTVLKLLSLDSGKIGLSGILFPNIYSNIFSELNFKGKINLEIKYNFIQNQSINHYKSFDEYICKKYAYGIGMGGLKLDKMDYTSSSKIKLVGSTNSQDNILTNQWKSQILALFEKYNIAKSLYHLSLIYLENDNNIDGYIIGPSKISYLNDIFSFLEKFNSHRIELNDFDLK